MGLLGDIFKIAAGVAIGNSAIVKEERKQAEREREEYDKQLQRAEYERKHREAIESQRQWEAVRKANQERRRKGQPELPLPPRSWY